MPRARRNFTAGGIYHVYSRGSNRQALFRFDADRLDFLSCFERVAKRHHLACYAYCLMPNHFHLVVETPDGRLSEAMKALNGRYALRFNRRYGCDAHLFKNRFGAVSQETTEQFHWTLRYAVRNPVDAGLCADPGEWPGAATERPSELWGRHLSWHWIGCSRTSRTRPKTPEPATERWYLRDHESPVSDTLP
jgi:putative transposase